VGSLTAHLVEAGDHGRLRFHPSCPVCRRERLFGTLSSEPVVSRRAQAVIAGGLLAVSSAAPGAVFAAEPDRQVEGVATPEQPTGVELDDPGFDPGGDTALPFHTAPVPTVPGSDGEDAGDGAPLDVEPVQDLDGRLAPLTDTEPQPLGEEAPVPPAEVVSPGVPGEPSVPDQLGTPSPSTPAPGPPHDHGSETGAGTTRPDRARGPSDEKPGAKRDDGAAPTPRAGTGRPALAPAPYVAPAPAPAILASQPVAVAQPVAEDAATGAATTTRTGRLGEHSSYLVEPGDSLWSIAKRLLGREASPARIAREVNRLWSLNAERIATGDPDLLMVGTKLQLR
jgi:nucleoid-associated protein YgaU